MCVNTRPYPGIVEALDAFARQGTPLAVLTNKPGDLARALLRVDRDREDSGADQDGSENRADSDAHRGSPDWMS